MGTLLIILAVLFLALIIVIPLVEKHAPKEQGQDFSKITRWIIPLMLVLLVLQLLRHMFA
jgi:heme A synthase